MTYKTLDDLSDISGKRALVRVDINVPMDGDRVTDTTRMERVKPTLLELADKGAKVIVLAHYGRPKGKADPALSLERLTDTFSKVLSRTVTFAPDDGSSPSVTDRVAAMQDGDILLLENSRFYPQEEANDPGFAKGLAGLGDLYVNDAFSAAHRAHATTEGIAHHLPSYAGRTLQAELEALQRGLGAPDHPVMALVGGAKVSTKLDLLGNLVTRVDHLVIGGGMANTFLAALGHDVGASLCEHDLADTAREIMDKAEAANCEIILPSDVVVAEKFAAHAPSQVLPVGQVPSGQMILDAGPETIELIGERIRDCRTLVWNGPLGAFELQSFDKATVLTAQEAARATQKGGLVSIAGGGDTVAALAHAGVVEEFTYVSTAGGAFLEWMEGKTLPGVAALEQNDQ